MRTGGWITKTILIKIVMVCICSLHISFFQGDSNFDQEAMKLGCFKL